MADCGCHNHNPSNTFSCHFPTGNVAAKKHDSGCMLQPSPPVTRAPLSSCLLTETRLASLPQGPASHHRLRELTNNPVSTWGN